MKVLLVNASPHEKGCTARALEEVAITLQNEGLETETVNIGKEAVRGCLACGYCHKHGKCVHDDCVNVIAEKFAEADGIIFGK